MYSESLSCILKTVILIYSDLNTLNDSDGIVGILCINSVDNYIENIF